MAAPLPDLAEANSSPRSHQPFLGVARPALSTSLAPARAMLGRAGQSGAYVLAASRFRTSRQVWAGLPASVRRPLATTVAAAGGALACALPVLLVALAAPSAAVAQIGLVLIAVVAVVAFLGGWLVGTAGLLSSALAVDALAVGGSGLLDLPWSGADAIGLLTTVGAGAAVTWLLERVRRQGERDRHAATAARAAANALTNLETIAANSARGDESDRDRLIDALLSAMVRVNRAHAGALFLVSEQGELTRAAAYGLDHAADDRPSGFAVGEGFLGRVALERRTLSVPDVREDFLLARGRLAAAGIRSVLATPIVADDRLLGVVHLDLLVPHRFTATEVARLEALANRAAALLERGRVAENRRLLLEQVRADLRRLRMVISAMPEAVILASPDDGRIIASNTAAETLFGPLSVDGEVSQEAPSLWWPDGQPAAAEETPVGQAFLTGAVASGVELVARRPDGIAVPVLASAAPLRESDGSVSAVVGVFQDVGPFKEATRLQDEFVSVISHDLRAPLTPIRGFIQLVARDLEREGGHELQAKRLRSLDPHIDRMCRLVGDLLDVSRARAGRLEIQREPTELVALCREVIEVRRPSSPDHVLDLVVGSVGDGLVGDLDPLRMHQVIDNLVSNAIKYSPEGGRVTLTVGRSGTGDAAEAVITVADEGPGIPKASREHVFSAFYRAPEAAGGQTPGLGLGLFICHELVTAHGGTIHAGTTPTGGALLTVRLPLVTGAASRAA